MVSYGAIGDRRLSSGMSSSVGRNSSTPPTPLSIVTRIAFYSFGVVTLIPWNALILDLPYLLKRLADTPHQASLGSWLTITYNASGLVALAVATWLADKLRPTPTITVSICFLSLTFLALAILPLWHISSAGLFAVTLVGSVALACSTSFFRTPVVAIASVFGPEATTSYLSGTALVAVAISAGVFLTAVISDTEGIHDGKLGMILAFAVSALVCLSSLAAYQFGIRHTEVFVTKFKSRAEHTRPERDWLVHAQLRMVLAQGEGVWATTKRNLGYNLAQCWIFAVMSAVYPAITTRVFPTYVRWTPLVFKTFHFLVFNLGDLTGRLLVSLHVSSKSPMTLFIHCILQTLLVPLFLLCNVSSPKSLPITGSSWPIVGQLSTTTGLPSFPKIGDIGFLSLVFIFALNAGYASSLGFVSVGNKKGARARTGARVLQLWLYVGFAIGSVASLAVERWMR